MVVSPITEHVTTVDRVGGLSVSKSLQLTDVAPCAVAADRDFDQLWVYGERGTLVRLSNDLYQPTETTRVQNVVTKAPTWLTLGRSATDQGRLRNTSAQRRRREENTDQRLLSVVSDIMLFAPSQDGVIYHNATQAGINYLGILADTGTIDAAAFDPETGYIYFLGQRGRGYIALIDAHTTVSVVSVFQFANIEGAIQARVVGTDLHIICAQRNRWQIWDITVPDIPTLVSDTPYDSGYYWSNPLRNVTQDGAVHRRFGTETGFVPGNLPVTDGGYVTASPATDPDLRWALLGEVAQITMTVPDILPITVYRTGGLFRDPLVKSGGLPAVQGTITDATSPIVDVVNQGGTFSSVTEAAAYDKNGQLVYSDAVKATYTLVAGPLVPPPAAHIRIGYYDCLEGLVPYNAGRNWQGVSDGSTLIYPFLRYRVDDDIRARVGTGASTTSGSRYFQNPTDPTVTVKASWPDATGMLVVELAAAPTPGKIVTIQSSVYPSTAAAELAGYVRQVPVVMNIVPITADGAASRVPAAEAYNNDSSGHEAGFTYRFRYVSGSFQDGANFFCLNRDGTSMLRIRTLTASPFPAPTAPAPDATWTAFTATLDLAASAAAAEAIAAGQFIDIVLPAKCRMAIALLSPPVGCTGSVVVSVQNISTGPLV